MLAVSRPLYRCVSILTNVYVYAIMMLAMKAQCCPPRLPADLSAHAALVRAIADPHRLRILASLARVDDAVCVCDLNDGIDVSQPTVSHHLKLLKQAQLVTSERRGTWIYYRLTPDARRRLEALIDLILPEKARA